MTSTTHPTCRHCGADLEMTLVDLGLSPLANSYVDPAKADKPGPGLSVARPRLHRMLVGSGG